MDFNQIRYFLALADTLNFTQAAERSNVTQPALTQAIQRLEKELGGELIHREGRHTRLTKLGQKLCSQFEQIERTRSSIKAIAATAASGETIELNIGLMCTIGPRILAPFLETFQAEKPHIRLLLHDVKPDDISELLLAGVLDGALCARQVAKHPRCQYTNLFRETMVCGFADGHEFSALEKVPLILLSQQPYIDRLHCEFRDTFLRFFEAHDCFQPQIVFSSAREDWIQGMILRGTGVSILPEYSLLELGIQHRPITDPELVREVEFVTTAWKAPSEALSVLIERAQSFTWPSG